MEVSGRFRKFCRLTGFRNFPTWWSALKSARGLTWLSLGILVVVVLMPLQYELRAAVLPQDEGFLLVGPTQVLHGAVPNQSFESMYGPATLLAVAGSFKLFGVSVTAERLVGLLYWFILVGSLTLLVGRRRGPIVGFVAGLLASVLLVGPIGLVAYAWVGAIAFGSLGLLFLDVGEARHESRTPWLLACGVCFGLVVSYRIDLSLAVALVTGLLLMRWRRRVVWLFAGIAIGLVPSLVNLAQAGVGAVIRDEFLQPVFVIGPGRRLPLSSLSHSDQLILAACIVIVVSLLSVGVSTVRSGGSLIVLAIGLFDLGLVPQALQRSDGPHVAYVACVILPASLLLTIGPLKRRIWSVVLGVMLLALLSSVALLPYGAAGARSLGFRSDPDYPVTNEGRTLLVGSSSDQHNLSQLLSVVDARAKTGQRLFIGPDDLRRTNYNDTYLYFLLPRLQPGSFYLDMEPGVVNGSSSQLAANIRGDQWLILTNRYDTWSEPNTSRHYGSDAANKVIGSLFHTVGHWGPWSLLVRDG